MSHHPESRRLYPWAMLCPHQWKDNYHWIVSYAHSSLLNQAPGHRPIHPAVKALAHQATNLVRGGRFYIILIVIPKGHAIFEAHLGNGHDPTIIGIRYGSVTDFRSDIIHNHRGLVMARAACL